MKQVAATLRDLSLNTQDAVLPHLNRELGPVVKELRRRFNERHGVVVEVSAAYSVTVADEVILVDATDGAVTITLLPIEDATMPVTVKKVDSTANAVTTTAADQIDGVDSFTTVTAYASITFVPGDDTYSATGVYP